MLRKMDEEDGGSVALGWSLGGSEVEVTRYNKIGSTSGNLDPAMGIVEAGIDDLQIYGNPIAADVASDGPLPGLTRFLAAAPNPFHSGTLLRFELASRGRAVLDIYDVQGRRVARLVEDALDAGLHSTPWDGRSASGQLVAPGVYVGRLRAAGATTTLKLVLTR